MMKKKILAAAMSLTMLAAIGAPALTDGAFAAEKTEKKVISGTTVQDTAPGADEILLDGLKTGLKVEKNNGAVYYPARGMAMALGYNVEWNGSLRQVELTKGDKKAAFLIDRNQYAAGKEKAVALSSKPLILNGRAFLPKDALTHLLGVEGQGRELFRQPHDQMDSGGFTVKEVSADRIKASRGELDAVLIIYNKETVFFDKKSGKEIKASSLKAGDLLKVTHSTMMKASAPPQYTAARVERLSDMDFTEATVISVSDKGIYAQAGETFLVFNIDKKTKITNRNGDVISAEKLTAGNRLEVYHSLAVALSLPPQTYAYEIKADVMAK